MSKEKLRCEWCLKGGDIYIDYHDKEWGHPVHDDQKLFEFLVLESFQAGLSWLTVLKKRDNFRKAFANFDAKKVAKFDKKKMEQLMHDAGIIRNRLKIEAAINNAKCFLAIQKEFGSFDKYVWGFVKGNPIINKRKGLGPTKCGFGPNTASTCILDIPPVPISSGTPATAGTASIPKK